MPPDDVGCQEGETDDLVDALPQGPVRLSDAGKGLALLDAFEPTVGARDISDQRLVPIGGSLAKHQFCFVTPLARLEGMDDRQALGGDDLGIKFNAIITDARGADCSGRSSRSG
jgi:hypothetical protein